MREDEWIETMAEIEERRESLARWTSMTQSVAQLVLLLIITGCSVFTAACALSVAMAR